MASKPIQVSCSSCERETNHTVLEAVEKYDQSPDGDIQVWTTYEIVQCRGCDGTSFRKVLTCSEDVGHDPDTGEMSLIPQVSLYPPRLGGRKRMHGPWQMVPQTVQRVYDETAQAMANEQAVLAGIGIRLITETVCKDRGGSGNLVSMINQLVGKGILTQDGADILHGTRLLGNDAAHGAVAASPDVLNAAMDVVEYLIRGVYLLPAIASTLPKPKTTVPAVAKPKKKLKKSTTP